MFPRSGMVAVFTIVLVASGSTLAADDKSVAGTVIGKNSKPFEGAEIRVRRVDAKAAVAIATTDGRGIYVFKGLPVGKYLITAYVDGFAKSTASITTPGKGWTKVDFDLRLEARTNESVARMQHDLQPFTNRSFNQNPH
jgi:carboxypeptidase family protein